MILSDVPQKTWVKVKYGKTPPCDEDIVNQKIFFDHLDGLYSFCIDENGNLVHMIATTEVEIIK